MMKDLELTRITIGTRGSALALAQTNWVAAQLRNRNPGLTVDTQIIHTRGDKIRDVALSQVGGKGLFTREIEEALLAGQIDLAVHSLKDLPTDFPIGLCLGAVPPRVDPHDVLILPSQGAPSLPSPALLHLPPGARVGTSSLRRQAQLRHIRPELEYRDLRGNLDTRLRKLEAGAYDAIVLAAAGLVRMGWRDRRMEPLPLEVCLPAVGQGALGLECRCDDAPMLALLQTLNHPATLACVTAERAFLSALGGGCQIPLGAIARVQKEGSGVPSRLHLSGLVARLDGREIVRDEVRGEPEGASELGKRLATSLLAKGAQAILQEVRP